MDKKRVIALGFFDGIHIGHSALMKKTQTLAREKKLTPSVITFDTHPLCIVSGKTIPLINSPEDRAGLIHREFGIDDVIFLHFDKETANMPWDRFIDHMVNEFGALHLVAGHDFRFGHGGEGTSDLLQKKSAELGLGCDIIPEIKIDGVTCSSTYIRKLISGGDIERANAFLGHPHVLTDVVRYGYRLGRTLGTPTINMRFDDGILVPAFGVYATKVYLEGLPAPSAHSAPSANEPSAQPIEGNETKAQFPYFIGVTNIGIRPTVRNSGMITAETHILDFQGNLYGRQVRIEFH